MPPNQIGNNENGVKTEESSRTRRLKELIAQADESSDIYMFVLSRSSTKDTNVIDSNGNARVLRTKVPLEDRFYSTDRQRLYRYYQENLIRFQKGVEWKEVVLEVSENIRNQVDDRILHTQIDHNTETERIIGYINL